MRRRFPRGNRFGICANSVLALFLAGPVAAMTVEDCARVRDMVVAAVPSAGEVRISSNLSEDGWCRVIGGPIGGGLEFRVDGTGTNFAADFRQRQVELETLGPFTASGSLRLSEESGLKVGPVLATARNGDFISFLAEGTAEVGSANVTFGQAVLSVSGDRGLVAEVLAWAFRLDVRAARSNLTEARDQRQVMLDWLADLPGGVGDAASRTAFREIVAAYPNARGTAELQGGDAVLGPLLRAVLYGASFTRGDGADLLRKTGLRLTWTPS